MMLKMENLSLLHQFLPTFWCDRFDKMVEEVAGSAVFHSFFLLFRLDFSKNVPIPLRQFPYCVRWLPYSVGQRNKEIRRQPYCIGAQEGWMGRSLPFVEDFVAFMGGEK